MMQNDFITALVDPTRPVPGGGATAAYVGVIALALFEKIVRVEMRRRPGAAATEPWDDLLEQTVTLTKSLRRLCERDAASYRHLVRTKTSGGSRAEVLQALQQAIDCPLQIMEQACQALDCVSRAAAHVKSHLLSDLKVVCELLDAAGRGARHIAQANVILLADQKRQADDYARLDRLRDLGCIAFQRAETAIQQSDDKI